jgi:hypothetical protein
MEPNKKNFIDIVKIILLKRNIKDEEAAFILWKTLLLDSASIPPSNPYVAEDENTPKMYIAAIEFVNWVSASYKGQDTSAPSWLNI